MAKIKIPKKKPIGIQHIEIVLLSRRIPFVAEHQFLTDRKFRFDFAMPDRKIAIEYEGTGSNGSISRHQTNTGYSGDCIKYNLAVVNGWKVLRFTSQNYKEIGTFLSVLYPNN